VTRTEPSDRETAISGSGRSLALVRQVHVPRSAVDVVHEHLQEMGRAGCEGVGFWAGQLLGSEFLVRAGLVPTQVATSTLDGLAVVIPGEELFRMNVWLHQNGMTLIAQLHSHPGSAYHSETDDALAVVTRVGSLSIVVPDYAANEFSLATAAVHRLHENGTWRLVMPSAAAKLIRLSN
jgi:hypothetical protein